MTQSSIINGVHFDKSTRVSIELWVYVGKEGTGKGSSLILSLFRLFTQPQAQISQTPVMDALQTGILQTLSSVNLYGECD